MNPDRPCPHEDFVVAAEVSRIRADDTSEETYPTAFAATIQVRCKECDEKFRWIGLPYGLTPDHPTVSVDKTEMRAPMRPGTRISAWGCQGSALSFGRGTYE